MTRRLQARSGVARQLVILCHGVGSNADDLIGLAPHWAGFLPDAAFVSPDGPEAYDMAPFGRQWFSLQDRSPVALLAGARRATPWLLDFIEDELVKHDVAAEQVAIMGFSQGGMMALFAGLRRPVPPAAILSFSGGLIAPETLAADRTGAPQILMVHGLKDDVVPSSWTADSAETLKAAGLPVQTLFCPELGHSIDEAGMLAGAQALRRAFP